MYPQSTVAYTVTYDSVNIRIPCVDRSHQIVYDERRRKNFVPIVVALIDFNDVASHIP